MKLQEILQKDLELSIINKDNATRNLLKVVIAELSRSKEKEVSDDEMTRVIRRMKEGAIQCGNLQEVPILDKYLPQMLNEDQIKVIIEEIIKINNFSSIKDMGKVMMEIKKHPQSTMIDGKLSNTIVREILK